MTKKWRTRRALINSVISLLICFSMFLGTTFAWFTDSVESKNNIIKAGNLDVELEYWNGSSYVPVDPVNTNLFASDLWEPGHVEYANLKVVNEGSLALKYQLQAYVYEEQSSINQKDDEFNLSDYIKLGIIEGRFRGSRKEAISQVQDVADVNILEWSHVGELYPENTDGKSTSHEVTLVIWMPETVGNEANHKQEAPQPSVTFGVNLYATQLVHEKDSFGPEYDEDAFATKVTTEEELFFALDKSGKIILENNIELTDTMVINDVDVVISGGSISVADGADFDHMFKVGSTNTVRDTSVVFKNVTIDGENTKRLLTVQKSAEVTIEEGAVFKNGRGTLGAGATVVGVLNLDGGTFDNCNCLTGASPGGAVYMGGGTFNMSAGKITNCENYNHGSAVGFLWNPGVFNMTGGVIENCKNSNNKSDAAVYLGHADAVANISGGSIINNDAHQAEPYATGVDIAKGTVNLSGNVAINNAGGAAGLYMNGKIAKVTGALTGENAITVACNVDGTVIAQGDGYTLTEDDLGCFENLADGYTLKLEGNQIVCVEE